MKLRSLQTLCVILFILGVIGVGAGLPRAITADLQFDSPKGELTSVNLFVEEPKYEFVFERIKLNFDTMRVFVGDEIGITANANQVHQNVTSIAVLLTKPDLDIVNMTNDEIKQEIWDSLRYRTGFMLSPDSDPSWTHRTYVPFLFPQQQVVMQAVVFDKNDIIYKIPSDEVILIVSSEADKLGFDQRLTNEILIGVGYAGIGVMLIIGAIDVLVRIRQKQVL